MEVGNEVLPTEVGSDRSVGLSEMFEIHGAIEDRLDRGESLEVIDAEIGKLNLPDDQKDALSLYAWAWRSTGPFSALEVAPPVA